MSVDNSPVQPISVTRARFFARVAVFVLLLALAAVVLALSAASGAALDEVPIETISLSIYALVAGVVVFRRDGHLVGWLLLAEGSAVVTISRISLVPGLPEWVGAWSQSFGWPMVFALFAALTLVFPSGRLPTGTGFWPRTARAVAVWLPIAVGLTAFTKLTGGPVSGVNNPFGILPLWMWSALWGSTLLALVGGATSLVFRRRGAKGAERAQLGWVVLPLAVLAILILATTVVVFTVELVQGRTMGDNAWSGVFIAMLSFPIAFGVAVSRYRLYEIDRIISRTVSYGLITAVLASVYLGTVFVLGLVLPLEGNWAVAASTLLSAALFNPLRRRIQAVVDRRFNRSRFDAQLTMEAMSRRLSTEVDLGALGRELQGVALQTMQPETVAVWLRGAP